MSMKLLTKHSSATPQPKQWRSREDKASGVCRFTRHSSFDTRHYF